MSNAKKKRVSLRGSKGTIQRVLKLIQPYRGLVLFTLLLAAVTVLTTLYAPILSGRGVDLIVGQGNVNFPALGKIAIQFGVTVCVTSICQWLMNMVNNRITFQVVRDIRVQAFQHMEILPLSYMDAHKPGDAISRINTDVEQFSDGLLMGFTQLFTGILTIVGTLGFMLSIDWRITLIVVVLTPLSIFVAKFIAEHTYDMFRVQSETRAELTGLVDELIGNEHLVRAFGYESRAEERFDKINADLQICGVKATFFSSITNPATRFVNALVYAAGGVVGALVAIGGGITVGELSVLLNYANQYTKPFNDISGVMTELQNALACAQRVFDFIDEDPILPDAPDAVTLPHGAGSVEFEHVKFRYVPDVPLIENMNLRVQPGQRIALVGPTGCGKTSLLHLITRFYDVTGGSVTVDGVDVRQMPQSTLRGLLGYVPQKGVLFSGTIDSNLKFGGENITDADVRTAARIAQAEEFISAKPEGYESPIAQGGTNVSGGQKQRLSIARAIAKHPKIYLFDDSFSALDYKTDVALRRALKAETGDATVIIVAQRISTVLHANQILVLEDGRIVGKGTHAQLMESCPAYQEIARSQLSNKELDLKGGEA